jgi:DNA-binding LytR/AlgR family response regulator
MPGIFKQPFPFHNSFRKKVTNALLTGFIVVIFLRVFSPFGFGEAPVNNLTLFAIGYGLVTIFIVIVVAIFELIFPKIFREEKWTVGKNIILYVIIIFLIGTANLFYTSVVTGLPVKQETFFAFQFITLSVTIIVVSALTMLRYFRSLKFYKKEAVNLENEFKQIKTLPDHNILNIHSENQKENLQLDLKDLFYIEAADNYSKVVFRKNGKINSTLIRSSLKRIAEQFNQPELFRCHRTFIVQLRNVEKVSGNSQGYRLYFKDLNESVPVSRRSGIDLHQRIEQLV